MDHPSINLSEDYSLLTNFQSLGLVSQSQQQLYAIPPPTTSSQITTGAQAGALPDPTMLLPGVPSVLAMPPTSSIFDTTSPYFPGLSALSVPGAVSPYGPIITTSAPPIMLPPGMIGLEYSSTTGPSGTATPTPSLVLVPSITADTPTVSATNSVDGIPAGQSPGEATPIVPSGSPALPSTPLSSPSGSPAILPPAPGDLSAMPSTVSINPLHQSTLSQSRQKPTPQRPVQPNPHLGDFYHTSIAQTIELQAQLKRQLAATSPIGGGGHSIPPNSIAPLLSSELPNVQFYSSFSTYLPSIPAATQQPPGSRHVGAHPHVASHLPHHPHHQHQTAVTAAAAAAAAASSTPNTPSIPTGATGPYHYQTNPYTSTSRLNCTLPLSQLPNGGAYAMLGQRGVPIEFGNDGLPIVKTIKKIKFSLATVAMEDVMGYAAYMGTFLARLSYKIDNDYLYYLAVKTEYERQTNDVVPTPYYYPRKNLSIDPSTGRMNHARIADCFYLNALGQIDLSILPPVVNDFPDITFAQMGSTWQDVTPVALPPLSAELQSRPLTKDDVLQAYRAITASPLDPAESTAIAQLCKTQLGSLLFQQTIAMLHADAQNLPRPGNSQCTAVTNGWSLLGYTHPCPSLRPHRQAFPGQHVAPAVPMSTFVDFLNATNPPGLAAGRTHKDKASLSLSQVQDNNHIVTNRLLDALSLQFFSTQRFLGGDEHAKFLFEAMVNYLLVHIQHCFVDISMDVCGNYILQTLIPFFTQEQIYNVASSIAPRIHELSCHNQSTRVIQALLYHADYISVHGVLLDGLLKMGGILSYYVEKIIQHQCRLRQARRDRISTSTPTKYDEEGYPVPKLNQVGLWAVEVTQDEIDAATPALSANSNGSHFDSDQPVKVFTLDDMRDWACGFSPTLPSRILQADSSIEINDDSNVPVAVWTPTRRTARAPPGDLRGGSGGAIAHQPYLPVQNCFCKHIFPSEWALTFPPVSPSMFIEPPEMDLVPEVPSAATLDQNPVPSTAHAIIAPSTLSPTPSTHPSEDAISISSSQSAATDSSKLAAADRMCFCKTFHHQMLSYWTQLIRSDLAWHTIVPIMLRFPLWLLALSGFTTIFSSQPSLLTNRNGVNVAKRFSTTLHPKHLLHYFDLAVLPFIHNLAFDPLGNFVIQQLIDRTLSRFDTDVFVDRRLQYHVSNAVVEAVNLRQQCLAVHTCETVLSRGQDPEEETPLKKFSGSNKMQATLCALLGLRDPTKPNDYIDDIFATPISYNGQGGQSDQTASRDINGEILCGVHVACCSPIAPLSARSTRSAPANGLQLAPLPFNPRHAWSHPVPIVDQSNEVAMMYFRRNWVNTALPTPQESCSGCIKFSSYKIIAEKLVQSFGGQFITLCYSKAASCIYHHFFVSRSALYTSVTVPLWQYICQHGIPPRVAQEPCGRSVMNRLCDIVPAPSNPAELMQHQLNKERIKAALSQAASGNNNNSTSGGSGGCRNNPSQGPPGMLLSAQPFTPTSHDGPYSGPARPQHGEPGGGMYPNGGLHGYHHSGGFHHHHHHHHHGHHRSSPYSDHHAPNHSGHFHGHQSNHSGKGGHGGAPRYDRNGGSHHPKPSHHSNESHESSDRERGGNHHHHRHRDQSHHSSRHNTHGRSPASPSSSSNSAQPSFTGANNSYHSPSTVHNNASGGHHHHGHRGNRPNRHHSHDRHKSSRYDGTAVNANSSYDHDRYQSDDAQSTTSSDSQHFHSGAAPFAPHHRHRNKADKGQQATRANFAPNFQPFHPTPHYSTSSYGKRK